MLKIVLVTAGAAGALLFAGVAATHALSGTESTTTLDKQSAGTVDGHPALLSNLVEGRTMSKFHPLPWVGDRITEMACPADLPAVVGATMSCTAKTGDRSIRVPIHVVKVDGARLTWKFER